MKKLILAGLLVGASVLPAYAQSCGDLWYERNAIYKDAGYCFKTARGIRAFGDAGVAHVQVYPIPPTLKTIEQIAPAVELARAMA